MNYRCFREDVWIEKHPDFQESIGRDPGLGNYCFVPGIRYLENALFPAAVNKGFEKMFTTLRRYDIDLYQSDGFVRIPNGFPVELRNIAVSLNSSCYPVPYKETFFLV